MNHSEQAAHSVIQEKTQILKLCSPQGDFNWLCLTDIKMYWMFLYLFLNHFRTSSIHFFFIPFNLTELK